MIINEKNQNDILDVLEIEHVFENYPINRIKKTVDAKSKTQLLVELEEKIKNLENCELKQNSKKLVFSDGNLNSKIMIVGEAPGQKEDETGKPFVGDAGVLLNKMLNAINIKREQVYITNVINYRPPNNRKPENEEIKRYSKFLCEHIFIINPKILLLLGSTAMEALLGSKLKITKERGIWRELIIKNKVFKTMVSFHPAYLLRQPDQKKFSWIDLKEIRKEVDNSGINI